MVLPCGGAGILAPRSNTLRTTKGLQKFKLAMHRKVRGEVETVICILAVVETGRIL